MSTTATRSELVRSLAVLRLMLRPGYNGSLCPSELLAAIGEIEELTQGRTLTIKSVYGIVE